MKGVKKEGVNTSKSYISFFLHVKSTLYNTVSGRGVRSEYRIVIKCKISWNEHLNFFVTEGFIEKTVSFWDPIKKFRRCHQRSSTKKVILKKLHNIHRKTPVLESLFTCVEIPVTLLKRHSNAGVFL